jgi:hypothetical protein
MPRHPSLIEDSVLAIGGEVDVAMDNVSGRCDAPQRPSLIEDGVLAKNQGVGFRDAMYGMADASPRLDPSFLPATS